MGWCSLNEEHFVCKEHFGYHEGCECEPEAATTLDGAKGMENGGCGRERKNQANMVEWERKWAYTRFAMQMNLFNYPPYNP